MKAKNFIIIIVPLFLLLPMFIYFVFFSNSENVHFNNEKVLELSGNFNIIIDNNNFSEYIDDLPYNIEGKANEAMIVSKTLTPDEIVGDYIFIFGLQQWIKVYLDNELILERTNTDAFPMKVSPGTYIHFFQLPPNYQGGELKLELTSPFTQYSGRIPTIRIGSKAGLLFHLVAIRIIELSLCIFTGIIGLSLFILGFLIEDKLLRLRICLLGLISILISIWTLLENWLGQFLFRDIQISSFILFVVIFYIPILISAFLLTFEPLSKKWYMKGNLFLSVAVNIIVHLLQLSGITYYIDMIFIMILLLVISFILTILGICSYIREIKNNESVQKTHLKEDRINYLLGTIFAIFITVDLIIYWNTHKFMGVINIAFFFLGGYLLYYTVKVNNERRTILIKQQIYSELAYLDSMTGLYNRTAFEEHMNTLRFQAHNPDVTILIADMNKLKEINDTIGHSAGDWAITNIAKCLKQAFTHSCKCYRIGGDEFCVICENMKEKDFLTFYHNFTHNVSSTISKEGHQLSVSCGYCTMENKDADTCFSLADQLMYQEKRKYKEDLR